MKLVVVCAALNFSSSCALRLGLRRVLDTLRQRPLCSLRQPGHQRRISFPTTSKAMLTLVEMGIAS